MVSQKLLDQIIEHEGIRRFAYEDSRGYQTIGCGRLIDQRLGKGLSIAEIMYLLDNDINACQKQLEQNLVYKCLDTVRQEVLIEMCFNLGYSGLMGFKKMMCALASRDYAKAVAEMANSTWSVQIGKKRFDDLVYRMLHGVYR